MFFRKFLVRIRRAYNNDAKRLYLLSSLAVLVTGGAGIAVDILLPFGGAWNALRSVVLLPTAISMFILGYAVSLFLHFSRIRSNADWVPYRKRMSPSWRRRISAIVAAVMLVLIYANGYRVGYTPSSSAFAAVAIALFAFMRTTKEESDRERMGIPDARDVKFAQQFKDRQQQREKEKAKNRDGKRPVRPSRKNTQRDSEGD